MPQALSMMKMKKNMEMEDEKKTGTGKIILPSGIDMPISYKIATARKIFTNEGSRLSRDPVLSNLLTSYSNAVDASWDAMKRSGIIMECTRCAVEDGGSCCGKGIEDKFDVALLVVNLLLGSRLPDAREDPAGCWFLGPGGCTIKARHVICVNYLCKRLYKNIGKPDIQDFQQAMERETTQAFLVEERVKLLLNRPVSSELLHY